MDFLFPGFGVPVKYRSGNVQLALLLVIVRHLIMTLCVQMTAQETRLCGLLLQEHFGDVVEKVGTHLLKNGTQNLRTILHETGTSLNLVTAYFYHIQVCKNIFMLTVMVNILFFCPLFFRPFR